MARIVLAPVPPCDRLLLVVTPSEQKALKTVAAEMALQLTDRTDEQLGPYQRLHRGDELLAIAVRTKMGAVGTDGSAVMAWRFASATQAATILQMGMAFGISPEHQELGDVLVATSLLAYDQRNIIANEAVEYPRVAPIVASPSLLFRCRQHFARWQATYPGVPVRFGALLSGGAAISCASFRDRLQRDLQPRSDDVIVGGEMEGVGLVGVSAVPRAEPIWGVIKGISDFADEERSVALKAARTAACVNAVRFALGAVLD